MSAISDRDEKTVSMVLTEEETRYFRALLAWEPSHVDSVVKRKPVPERPVAGEFRILVLGAKGCGKTAILTRFIRGTFIGEGEPPDPQYERGCRRTIEIEDGIYKVDVLELTQSQLTEHQSLRNAVAITEAVVLVYDVRCRDSYFLIQDIHRRIEEVLALDKRQHYGLILVGNKADEDEDDKEVDLRRVSESEGYQLAHDLGGAVQGCTFCETSAKTGENIEDIFVVLGTELLELRRLAQQRREQAEELARMAAMEDVDGKNLAGTPRRLPKWRAWGRPWFRRASDEVTRKAAVV